MNYSSLVEGEVDCHSEKQKINIFQTISLGSRKIFPKYAYLILGLFCLQYFKMYLLHSTHISCWKWTQTGLNISLNKPCVVCIVESRYFDEQIDLKVTRSTCNLI